MGGKWSKMNPMDVPVPDLGQLLERDHGLHPFEYDIRKRYSIFLDWVDGIKEQEGGYEQFTRGYQEFGIHVAEDGTITSKEWAPGAEALYLAGDFNDWNRTEIPYERQDFGKWTLTLPPNSDGTPRIKHLSELKVVVRDKHGNLLDRISPWAKYVVQPPKDQGFVFKYIFYNPEKTYQFQYPRPNKPESLRIYESHVGIASAESRVATYNEFADNVIPRIVKLDRLVECAENEGKHLKHH